MTRSRHDRFPRHDDERRARLRAATRDLEAQWRSTDGLPGGLNAAIDAVADASPEIAIAALMPWLSDTGWLRERLAAATGLLAADPFARPPLRPVGGGEGAGGLILAERGAIRLSLQLHPAGTPSSTAALFIPGRSAFRILADGGAAVRFHEVAVSADEEAGVFTAAGAARCRTGPPRALVDGECWILDTARQAFTLSGATRDIVILELSAQPPSSLPIRSYDNASGRLLHVSASRRDSSFCQMALALLRMFGRADAAPLFVTATGSGDFAARWLALRDLIALDAAAAYPCVVRMAEDDPHPEVRHAAKAVLALYDRKEIPACLS